MQSLVVDRSFRRCPPANDAFSRPAREDSWGKPGGSRRPSVHLRPATADKALNMALDLIRGTKTNPAFPPNPKSATLPN
jgi:hypothetical protein